MQGRPGRRSRIRQGLAEIRGVDSKRQPAGFGVAARILFETQTCHVMGAVTRFSLTEAFDENDRRDRLIQNSNVHWRLHENGQQAWRTTSSSCDRVRDVLLGSKECAIWVPST